MVSLSRWHGLQEGKIATVELQRALCLLREPGDSKGNRSYIGYKRRRYQQWQYKQRALVNPVQLTLAWGKYGLQDYNVITTFPGNHVGFNGRCEINQCYFHKCYN